MTNSFGDCCATNYTTDPYATGHLKNNLKIALILINFAESVLNKSLKNKIENMASKVGFEPTIGY